MPWRWGCSPLPAATRRPVRHAAKGAAAVKEAGDKTIAAGLDQKAASSPLAKAAGLDATLAGPGPIPCSSRRRGLRQIAGRHGRYLMKPEARPDLTRMLTYHILPGTVLAEDIGKAIDAGNGKAQLATMGGGALTATREGDKIVLTDGAGGKADDRQGRREPGQRRHPPGRCRADAMTKRNAPPGAGSAFSLPLPRGLPPRYNEVQRRAKGQK